MHVWTETCEFYETSLPQRSDATKQLHSAFKHSLFDIIEDAGAGKQEIGLTDR